MNTVTVERNTQHRPKQAQPETVPASLVGEAGAWLSLERADGAIVLRPNGPMPRRCTIRPVAIFEHEFGFHDANTVMGRIVFSNGATEPQTYRPFTRDPKRKLVELFFPVEPMPTDDWPNSPKRWAHCQAIAKRLLNLVEVPWRGFTAAEIEKLVRFVHRPEPLDACLLHALAQWRHELGRCILEIGSFRGSSASVFAMALEGVGSDAPLISVDPHEEQPVNLAHVRLALEQIGQSRRLVQIPLRSDAASALLRPGIASLIFIDGDHGCEQVLADFRNYADLLAPGGCMLFHDYGCGDHNSLPDTNPGVREAVDRHVFGDKRFRPLLLAHTLLAFVKQG
jgi:predicted O-methyltransferase YrrM